MSAVAPAGGGLREVETRKWCDVKRGYTRFQEGDVLFAKITPCMENGKVAVANHLCGAVGGGSTEFHVLRPGEGLEKKYLFYLLQQEDLRREARARMTGTAGQLRVPVAFLQDYFFDLPAVSSQRRSIAAIESYFTRLDVADAALERVRANLKRYRASVLKAAVEGRLVPTEAELARREGREYEPASALLERILRERRRRWQEEELGRAQERGKALVGEAWKARYKEPVAPDLSALPDLPEGWCWATVDQLVWSAEYGTSQKCSYEAEGPPVLRIPNVQKQRLALDDLKFSTAEVGISPGLALRLGDFLFIRTNGSRDLIGRGALVTVPLHPPHYFASYLIRLRAILVEDAAKWLALAWHSSQLRDQLLRDAVSSAGQHNISLRAALQYVIPLPPSSEQSRILDAVSCAESVAMAGEVSVVDSAAKATRLRQAILKWAFEGRLVDQDPADEPASALLERIRAQRAASPKVGRRTRHGRAGQDRLFAD